MILPVYLYTTECFSVKKFGIIFFVWSTVTLYHSTPSTFAIPTSLSVFSTKQSCPEDDLAQILSQSASSIAVDEVSTKIFSQILASDDVLDYSPKHSVEACVYDFDMRRDHGQSALAKALMDNSR